MEFIGTVLILDLVFGMLILYPKKSSFEDKDAVTEKEVITLIKNFSAIKDPAHRKSIINLAKALSKNSENEEETKK